MFVYLFPFHKVNRDEKIVIWGAGIVGKEYIKQIVNAKYADVIGIIDIGASIKEYEGIRVYKPQEAEGLLFDCSKVVIANTKKHSQSEIIDELLNMGVSKDKIVNEVISIEYDDECKIDALMRTDVEILKKVMTSGMNTIVGLPQFLENEGEMNEYNKLYKKFIKGNKQNDSRDIGRLIFLWKNVESVLNRINGNIAELGVYKGSTACVLADYAEKYNRKLYLFDTFTGFDESDKTGIDKNRTENFADTSLNYVKRHVGHESNTIYYVGYFPETIDADCWNEKFSFVHIDCDLYKPIKEGLIFFYERMEVGGFIVVHDYLSGRWEGATQAVDEFCEQYGIRNRVLIPDLSGSVVIIKD